MQTSTNKTINGTLIALTALLNVGSLQASEMPVSGFFDSYSQLQPVEDSWMSYLYTSDNLDEILSTTQSVVISQPEIFLSDDSKYKGISPDEMKTLADTSRALLVDALSDKYQIASNPGPNSIVVHTALSNIHLKHKGRGLLGYTPIGFVATSAKRAMEDFSKKILLTEVVWEAEILDGSNGDVLGQLLVPLGNSLKKKEFTSWDDLKTAMSIGGLRLRCRLDNATANTTRDCLEITEED